MAEKEPWWRKESITADPEEEDPITENPKENPINENAKENLYYCENNAINGDPQELQDLQWLLHHKLTLFGFLVMVYDWVDDGDKFSKTNFDLGRLRFHATSHLQVVPILAQGL